MAFLRVQGEALDPTDAYGSPWVGEGGDATPVALYGEGRPIVGIHGWEGDSVYAIGLLAARDAKQPPQRFLRLTEVEPLSQQVGWAAYEVNQAAPENWPILPPSPRFCQEYLFAHAASRLSYAIPKAAKSFSAVSYTATGAVAFQVVVDGKRVFSSGRARVAPILIDLPPRAKALELGPIPKPCGQSGKTRQFASCQCGRNGFWDRLLVVDPLGNIDMDHSFWLLPRFHQRAAAQVQQLDGSEKHVKLTLVPPLAASVGAGEFLVNRVLEWAAPPLHVLELTPCDEFIYDHAPARAVFALPPAAKEFSAVGYCVHSVTVQFQVIVDGKRLAVSPKAGVVPLRVPLPRGAKRLELVVDPLEDNRNDHAYWCYPRVWW